MAEETNIPDYSFLDDILTKNLASFKRKVFGKYDDKTGYFEELGEKTDTEDDAANEPVNEETTEGVDNDNEMSEEELYNSVYGEDQQQQSQRPVQQQAPGENPKFQSFATYQEGKNALIKQLQIYQTGKSRTGIKPESTLQQAMAIYAPSSDNNDPKAYAKFVAGKLGVDVDTPISDIDTKKWADAIEIMEGNTQGNNPGNLKKFSMGGAPIARTKKQQQVGLNDPELDQLYMPLQGNNAIRGLDSGEPVYVKDEQGNEHVLYGPDDIVYMDGPVHEKRMQTGGAKYKKTLQMIQTPVDPNPNGPVTTNMQYTATDSNASTQTTNRASITPVTNFYDEMHQPQQVRQILNSINKRSKPVAKEVPEEAKQNTDSMLSRLYDVGNTYSNKIYETVRENEKQYTGEEYKNGIPLTQGKYNTGKIPKSMVADAVKAAKDNDIDPYDLLALAGQESTFGVGYTDKGKLDDGEHVNQQNVISGWNLDNKPKSMSLFLADKKVPGVEVNKTFHGWAALITDKDKVEAYLKQHPELIQEYDTLLSKGDYSNNGNYFDLAAKQIKKSGFKRYNPGDSDYPNKITKSKELLLKEKALTDYIASINK